MAANADSLKQVLYGPCITMPKFLAFALIPIVLFANV